MPSEVLNEAKGDLLKLGLPAICFMVFDIYSLHFDRIVIKE